MSAGKIAISMPPDVLRALERARATSGRSRSAIVTEAVREWLRSTSVPERDQRYVEAYLREPERVDKRRRRGRCYRELGAVGVKRGEVWWATLPDPAGRRPVILVSREASYAVRAAVTVMEVSTRIRGIASEVALGKRDGLAQSCVANADNLVTIPKVWLRERITALSPDKLAALDQALRFSLGLDGVA